MRWCWWVQEEKAMVQSWEDRVNVAEHALLNTIQFNLNVSHPFKAMLDQMKLVRGRSMCFKGSAVLYLFVSASTPHPHAAVCRMRRRDLTCFDDLGQYGQTKPPVAVPTSTTGPFSARPANSSMTGWWVIGVVTRQAKCTPLPQDNAQSLHFGL